ncbi:hypothetical protein H4R34_003639 [Dimargaris verticillata]|uniref:Alpha/beta hydrolase fold-3 domain-containing protein n=1 Tax=Dimargaris verticillata TaxID=2761393 RepID=A0A9W8B0G3_9FUNG|nr:hypothetical protein H4R34_003639 [Dimargaris verticillata]
MLDHLVGKPSATYHRVQVVLLTLCALGLLRRGQTVWLPRWLQRLNHRLANYAPWKLILAAWTLQYFIKRLFIVLGLHGGEPLARMYHPGYFRATTIFTALDAGFWTAMPIRPRWLRDGLSLVFSLVYLCFPLQADTKVRRVRQLITVDHMRTSWEKAKNPLLRLGMRLQFASVHTVRQFAIPRPRHFRPRQHHYLTQFPFRVHLYFDGPADELYRAPAVLYHIPGGGFVSMDPETHEDYLRIWAKQTKLPIVSINYRKAPEFPFPYALEECFDFYRLLAETNGACIGLAGWVSEHTGRRVPPIRIAMAGDSAGANLAAGVVIQAIENLKLSSRNACPYLTRLPQPAGLLLVYGCFDFNLTSWMTQADYRRMQTASSLQRIPSFLESRDHLLHRSPLATRRDTISRWRKRRQPSIADSVVLFDETTSEALERSASAQSLGDIYRDELSGASDGGDEGPFGITKPVLDSEPGPSMAEDTAAIPSPNTRLAMTSRNCFFSDRILTSDLLRAMAILYIGPNRRPDFARNYYLSPVVAPDHILAQFPPTSFVCGEKDPFVDDTVVLAARIREAKAKLADIVANLADGPMTTLEASLPLKHATDQPDHGVGPRATTLEFVGRRESDALRPLTAITAEVPKVRFYIPEETADEGTNTDAELKTTGTHPSSPHAHNKGSTTQQPPKHYQQLASGRGFTAAWQAMVTRYTQEELAELCVTATHVQIVEGISHAFLQMMAVFPQAKDLVGYMGQTIATLVAVPISSQTPGMATTRAIAKGAPEADEAPSHGSLLAANVSPATVSQLGPTELPNGFVKVPSAKSVLPSQPIPGAVLASTLVSRRRRHMVVSLGHVPAIDIPLSVTKSKSKTIDSL